VTDKSETITNKATASWLKLSSQNAVEVLRQATESSIRVVGLQIEIRSGHLSIAAPFGEMIILKKSSRNKVHQCGQDKAGLEKNLIADFYKHGFKHSVLEDRGSPRGVKKRWWLLGSHCVSIGK